VKEDLKITCYPTSFRGRVDAMTNRVTDQDSLPGGDKEFYPTCTNCNGSKGKPRLIKNVPRSQIDCPICSHALHWVSKVKEV
jgi:hypothetical protein